MRIAHLSTSRTGGAALAALRQSQALKSVGIVNDIFALGPNVVNTHEQMKSLVRTPSETLQSKSLSIFQKTFVQKGSELLTPISFEPKSIQRLLGDYELIHFHSTYNILNSTGLKNLIEHGKKIVITLHDQRWFTGGCHYSSTCDKFINSCHDCPQATEIGKRFVSKSQKESMKIFDTHPEIKVIAPSFWLSEKARRSRILSNCDISVIRNPIPQSQESHKDFEFSLKMKQSTGILNRIVFVADNLQNPLKGLDVLLAAFNSMSEVDLAGFRLLLIGNNAPSIDRLPYGTEITNISFPYPITNLLKHQDLLVVPSRQDNLPNVIGEAFSAGIKVLGSNVGGIPEVINPFVGDVFEKDNYLELADLLINFKYRYARAPILAHYESIFSYEVVGKQIANLYKK